MKKGLCRVVLSVMLMTAFHAGPVFAGDKDRKEKMQVVVVEKKERDKSGNGAGRQGHSGDRKP